MLRYTLMSIAYLAISRSESALLVVLQNLRANKAGSRPHFLTQERTFANKQDKTRFTTALLPSKDVSF